MNSKKNMAKKKAKKKIKKVKRVNSKKISKKDYKVKPKKNKWVPILWILGILVVIFLLLVFAFRGITGNVVMTGQVTTDTSNAFKPIVDMIAGFISSVYGALQEPLEFIVGDTSGGLGILEDSSSVFFAKILLIILVFAIVSSILSNFGGQIFEKNSTKFITSAIVAILSIRFLNADFIQAIIMPYSALGVVMTAIIPFVIYFFFVEKMLGSEVNPANLHRMPSLARKLAWVFFGLVFLIIWSLRQDSFSEMGSIVYSIYPFTAILAFIMALMDGRIQHMFNDMSLTRDFARSRSKDLTIFQDKINDCERRWQQALKDEKPDSYVRRYAPKNRKYPKSPYGHINYREDIEYLHDEMEKVNLMKL
jgi:hypothetical protein